MTPDVIGKLYDQILDLENQILRLEIQIARQRIAMQDLIRATMAQTPVVLSPTAPRGSVAQDHGGDRRTITSYYREFIRGQEGGFTTEDVRAWLRTHYPDQEERVMKGRTTIMVNLIRSHEVLPGDRAGRRRLYLRGHLLAGRRAPAVNGYRVIPA